MKPSGSPVRDKQYYLDGADCVIRVEDTLFRVHRFLLARDSSAFEDMFGMPGGPGEAATEGFSDEHPICLYGETVTQFRALLSVLYALPAELQAYNTVKADIAQLLTIAEATNKWHFASVEAWAIDAVYNVTSGVHGAPAHDLAHCTSAKLARVLAVALLCGHARLRDFAVDKWTHRILARELRPAPALAIADRHGLPGLAGIAYYVQLMEMGPNFAIAHADGVEDEAGEAVVLSREQRLRLLSGHWSLVRLWEHVRTAPPKFQRPDGCTYHQQGCLSTWAAVWLEVGKSETTLRYSGADVVGRLRSMEEQLSMHVDLGSSLTPQCKRRALLALKATVKEVQDGLADHFADLTTTDED
ncbi:hypothetical protein B0H21DRAFT_691983 [Amylocystis lapponica]|nr:hypothetical protein B0H21DRAFT_691983 [Amylocystis lapponica]